MIRTDAKMKKDEINSQQIDSVKATTNPSFLWKRIAGVLLIIHGLFCGVSALFPIHPVFTAIILVFRIQAGPAITTILFLAVAQLAFGGYLAVNWQVRWYWPAIITIAMGIIIAIAVPVVLTLFFASIPYM
jgi:hypothetical protein